MNRAQKNQIIVAETIMKAVEEKYECSSLGEVSLKGKSNSMKLFELVKQR
jgi:class 3 adenylate cyclase